jgi:hypothetical protein
LNCMAAPRCGGAGGARRGNAPNSVLAAAASRVRAQARGGFAPCSRRAHRPFRGGGTQGCGRRGFDVGAIGTDAAARALFVANERDPKPKRSRRSRGSRRALRVRPLLGEPRWTSDSSRRARRHRDDARLGAADAQARLAAYR